MMKKEVCIFVESEENLLIDYNKSQITMGATFKFNKLLKSTNQNAQRRMEDFISLERIKQVHGQNIKGCCICVHGSQLSHLEIYEKLESDYFRQLPQNELKVEVMEQGKEKSPTHFKKEDFKGKQQPFNENNYIQRILSNILSEAVVNKDLNFNITFYVYQNIQLKTKYSFILIQNKMDRLITMWTQDIKIDQLQLFNNTVEQSKIVLSFLKHQKNQELKDYLKDLSELVDQKQQYSSSQLNSCQKPINKLAQNQKLKKESLPSAQLQEINQLLKSTQNNIYVYNSEEFAQQFQDKKQIINEKLTSNRQIQISPNHIIHQSPSQQQLNAGKINAVNKNQQLQTPKQSQGQNQLSNKKDNKTEMEIKNITTITTKIQNLLEGESKKGSKIIQIYKDNIIINILDDSAFNKFQVSKLNYYSRVKIQLVDLFIQIKKQGLFDLKKTKIIFRKINSDSEEQQRKFKLCIENCLGSDMKYFYVIVGKVPNIFFRELIQEQVRH